MNAYLKNVDNTKTCFFLFKDEKLLTKYNLIWRNVKTLQGKKCDSDPTLDKNI